MDDGPREEENHENLHAMLDQDASGEVEEHHQQEQQQQQQQQPFQQQHAAGSAPTGPAAAARSSSLIYHQRYAGEGSRAGTGGGLGSANSSSHQQQQLRHQASSHASGSGGTGSASSMYYASSQHFGGRYGAESARMPFRVGGGVPERDAEHLDEEDAQEQEFSPASGWSEVELSQDGGAPPSARSLHAAAVLNGTMRELQPFREACHIFSGLSLPSNTQETTCHAKT